MSTTSVEAKGINQFAQELVDIIVSLLDTDKPSLFACTTLSRAFLEASRSYLFHTLHVNGADKEKSFKAFSKLLSSSKDIAKHIRALRLGRLRAGWEYWDKNLPPRPILSSTIFKSILSNIPSLQSLELADVNLVWDASANSDLGSGCEDRITPLPVGGSLRTFWLNVIEISNSDLVGPQQCLLNFFALASPQTELRVRRIIHPQANSDQPGATSEWHLPTELRAQRLALMEWTLPEDVIFLLEAARKGWKGSHKKLDIVCRHWEVVQFLDTFLEDGIGTELDALRIDFSRWDLDQGDAEHPMMKINKCTSLQELTIRILIDDMNCTESERKFGLALSVFSTMPPSVRRIKFEVDVDEFCGGLRGMMMTDDWRKLDGMLAGNKGLEKVDIVLVDRDANSTHHGKALDDVIGVIEERLPGLRARGILGCVDGTDRSGLRWAAT